MIANDFIDDLNSIKYWNPRVGDLGVGGMGISIGKLTLYTALAGIHPSSTLPITLDLGTDNQKLIADPLYMGSRSKKLSIEESEDFVDEFMSAMNSRWPGCVIQFEDWQSDAAFHYLERYRHKFTMFNDDIQGTGAVITSGFSKAVELSGTPAEEQRIVFYGAGSAAVGVALMIASLISKKSGLSLEDSRSRIYLVDTKGLVSTNRGDILAKHKQYFIFYQGYSLEVIFPILILRKFRLLKVF